MVKVSILLPTYNNYEDLGNAITSVMDQTYTDWELIIIDDASTDETQALLKTLLLNNKYPNNKINVITNEINMGTYISLNKALLIANGEYIARLDSDDMYHPTFLQKSIDILDNNQHIAVRSLYKRYFTNTNNEIFLSNDKKGDITLVYRKALISKIGYYDSVRFCADTEFTERLLKTNHTIYELNEVLYFAKRRENSLSTSPTTCKGSHLRDAYTTAFRKWHSTTPLEKLSIPYPQTMRPF
jgi:glycosyltransferase involved in cell wall biosynthesis